MHGQAGTVAAVLFALALGGPSSTNHHPFLTDEMVRTIDGAVAVRAYQLATPNPGFSTELGYLGGCVIVRQQPPLDSEQRGFMKWATASDRSHDEILKGIKLACHLPSIGFRFISAEDSVDVTVSPSCLSRWSFSMSRGSDLDHLTEAASSFAVIRPEMLTLLREVFPDEPELQERKGLPYRSNWPLQLPAAARDGQR